MWNQRIQKIEPLDGFQNLPDYALVFFFKNMGEFKWLFWLLTLNSVLSCCLKYVGVFLLSHIISNLSQLSLEQVFSFYIPVFLAAKAGSEILDYFTRRYGEAFSIVYSDHLTLRFYAHILNSRFDKLFNLSKERLAFLISKYVGHIQSSLNDWFWSICFRFTNLLLVLIVLGYQSITGLTLNIIYLICFLMLSAKLSANYSAISRRYSEQTLESSTAISKFSLNLNTVKRLGIRSYILARYRGFLGLNWDQLEQVRKFHGKRWLIQFNLFNALYLATLFYGVYQVKIGILSLGFLVLIQYSFDQLTGILIFVIEYMAMLVTQREDAKIFRSELVQVIQPVKSDSRCLNFGNWQLLELKQVGCEFEPKVCNAKKIQIEIPHFEIRRGEKIGILGESGVGKSTLLNILLNLVSYKGDYLLDKKSIHDVEIDPNSVTIINSIDPLFNLSLRDNIVLGRPVSADHLDQVLQGTRVSTFLSDLERLYGSADLHLSVGQEQRLRLARGLVNPSSLCLLDEPFNGIDQENKQAIISYMRETLKESAIVLVTHNREDLALVDQVYRFESGRLVVDSGFSANHM